MDTLVPRDERDTIEIVTAALANATPLEVSGAGTKAGTRTARHGGVACQHGRDERRIAL